MTATMLPVQRHEIPMVSRTMAKAFADDPVFKLLFGGHVPEDRASQFLSIMFRAQMRHGLVYRTPGHEAGAIWAPPGAWKLPISQIIMSAPGFVRVFGSRFVPNLRVLSTLEKAHPTDEPHYYLEFIGTDPAHQGRGMGSALIRPMVERCDTEGVGAYLESSKESNVSFYGRFGFEVTRVVTHRGERGAPGPPQWLMWRRPR